MSNIKKLLVTEERCKELLNEIHDKITTGWREMWKNCAHRNTEWAGGSMPIQLCEHKDGSGDCDIDACPIIHGD